jgi:hypothetical protein
MHQFRDLDWRVAGRILTPFVVLFVIGVIGRAAYPHNWPLSDLVDAAFAPLRSPVFSPLLSRS